MTEARPPHAHGRGAADALPRQWCWRYWPTKGRDMTPTIDCLLMACAAALIGFASGCAGPREQGDSVWRLLLTPEAVWEWTLNAWRSGGKPWVLKDGAYTGQCAGGYAVYGTEFGDFVLETEFLYDGSHGGGGIVLRGEPEAAKPWESGYELDINMAEDGVHGHLHFPVKPAPYSGKELLFAVGEWHRLRVEARGSLIKVTLDDDAAMTVVDRSAEFGRGHICLGDEPCEKGDPCEGRGHTAYRNMRVREQ